MKRESDNAWHYLKFSEDKKKLLHFINLIIEEDSPRYIKNLPDAVFEISKRIVDYKVRRAEINKIDSYFDE